ncbi:MAG: transposase [Bacteroidetes bacterium]|nr:MAG: transposase [Bacteroidota bacterium]
MKPTILTVCTLIALVCSACASKESETEKAEREAKEQIEKLPESMQGVAEALRNVQEKGEGSQPVNFRELKELLPSRTGGLAQTNSEGQTAGSMGFTISQANAEYEEGDKRISISIVDAAGTGAVVMGMAAWTMTTVDRESSDGYERTGTFEGHKSYEKYDKGSESASLSLFIANRFIVSVDGSKVSMDDVKGAAKDINLRKLEGLGK